MRDPDRIWPFATQLAQLWQRYPDLRFGQLIQNLSAYAKAKYNKDIFYIEEDECLQILAEYLGG